MPGPGFPRLLAFYGVPCDVVGDLNLITKVFTCEYTLSLTRNGQQCQQSCDSKRVKTSSIIFGRHAFILCNAHPLKTLMDVVIVYFLILLFAET